MLKNMIVVTLFTLAGFAFMGCEKQDYQNPFHRAGQNQ